MMGGYLDLSLGSSTMSGSMFKHDYDIVVDDGGYLDLSLGSSMTSGSMFKTWLLCCYR